MSQPTSLYPAGTTSVLPVLASVALEVQELEAAIVREEWLPQSHIARYGPRARDRKDGMVPIHRGWQSVQKTMRAGTDQTDLTQLRAALLELAGATVKFVADIDIHLSQHAPLDIDTDDPVMGVLQAAGGGSPAGGVEDDEETPD